MKPVKWPEIRLGDHIDLLCGFAFKSKDFTDDPNDIPLVKGANVHQGYIDWADSKYWPRIDTNDYSRYFLNTQDVVLAMDRPWIEAGLKHACIRPHHPKALLVQRVARMRGIGGLDSAFLRFVIGSPCFTDYIKSIVTGINVPHISADQIKGFRFLLPSLPIQRKIASILSAYDDLIENNTRRIALLEEMAQAIYREWFVHFRFPGHEKVKLVDSQMGKIPEGWRVEQLGNISDLQWGDTYTTKANYIVNGYKAFSAAGADGFLDYYDYDRNGIVLSAIGANCGRTWYTSGKWSCIKNTIRLWASKPSPSTEFLFFATKELTFWPRRGAAQPFISQQDARHQNLIVPTSSIESSFASISKSMLSEIDALQRKNSNLTKSRDLLLPKLINGKLDVEELDIDIGEPFAGAQA